MSIDEQLLTKRYVSWSRAEHLSEWTPLQLVSAATHDLVPMPLHSEVNRLP